MNAVQQNYVRKNSPGKLVRTVGSITILLLVMINLKSCNEGSIDTQSEREPKLVVTAQPEYLVAATAPRQIIFSINSNTPWTISSDQPWCKATPVFSAVSALIADITIETEPNETKEKRTATITVKGEKIEPQEITIVQDAMGELLVTAIDETDLFKPGGESKVFYVKSNKPWTVHASFTWLTLDKSSGEGSDEPVAITATAASNEGSVRRVTVSVKSGTEEQFFDVVQDGYRFEVTNTDQVDFSGGTETVTYGIEANIAWEAEIISGTEWLSFKSGSSGSSSADLVFDIANNTTLKARAGQIVIRTKDGSLGIPEVVLNLTQDIEQDGTVRKYLTSGHSFQLDFASGTSVEYNENGAVVSLGTGNKARFITELGDYKLGIYTWKLADIDFSTAPGAHLVFQAWPPSSPSTANYFLRLKPVDPHHFQTGGGFNFIQLFSANDLVNFNELKTLTIKVERIAGDKLKFSIYQNGDLILEDSDRTDVFVDPLELGVTFYFGLHGSGAATCTFEYFQYTPLD